MFQFIVNQNVYSRQIQ